MSKKNETPETTDAATGPSKRISLRKETLKALKVTTGVRGGYVAVFASVEFCTVPGGKSVPGGCAQSVIIPP